MPLPISYSSKLMRHRDGALSFCSTWTPPGIASSHPWAEHLQCCLHAQRLKPEETKSDGLSAPRHTPPRLGLCGRVPQATPRGGDPSSQPTLPEPTCAGVASMQPTPMRTSTSTRRALKTQPHLPRTPRRQGTNAATDISRQNTNEGSSNRASKCFHCSACACDVDGRRLHAALW